MKPIVPTTSTNPERENIFKHIKEHTPEEQYEHAAAFVATAETLNLSPYTIEAMFLLGKKHTDNQKYDIRNLSNVRFLGLDGDEEEKDVRMKSVAHNWYRYGLRFRNRQDSKEKKGKGMGWTTGSKFLRSLRSASISITGETPITDDIAERLDHTRRHKKDYAETLDQVLKNPELIKDIQSTTERRKVQALIGLDEAIKEASDNLYENFTTYMQSADFYSENVTGILELLLPKGGVKRRLKTRTDLPERVSKMLSLVTKNREIVDDDLYDTYMTELEAYDQETALIDMRGHARRYIHDLQDLAEKRTLKDQPAAMLNILTQLQTNQPIGTAASLAAFVQLYDVHKERTEHYIETIMRSPDFQLDHDAGEAMLKETFIEGSRWKGSGDDSIPIIISESLEGIVKRRGDPFLKQAQRWMKNIYASEDLDNHITTRSMRETDQETEAVVILERRKQSLEQEERSLIDNRHRLAEDFENDYGLSLNEFIGRMEDQKRFLYKKKGDWAKQEDLINAEAKVKLYVPERFGKIEHLIGILRDEFTYLTEKEQGIMDEYHALKRLSYDLPEQQVEQLDFSPGKKYVRVKEIEDAKHLIESRGETIRSDHLSLEEKRRTDRQALEERINQVAHEYKNLIVGVSEEFAQADFSERRRIYLHGTRYEEKGDLKARLRARWDPDQKLWYIEPKKEQLIDRIENIKEYNKGHKGKLSLNLK